MATTASPARLPVDLVTGFLGSGKTTLINAVLRDPAFAGTMVVVNEFGEVGLDHLLFSVADDQVVLLSSGCLCCAASGTLRDTLIDLFARRSAGRIAPFERIIVETSGLANPAPLVATLIGDSALTPRCFLSRVLTVVDACRGRETLDNHEEARLQVALADQLLLTKSELADAGAVQVLRARLHAINASAPLASWRRDEPASPHFLRARGPHAFRIIDAGRGASAASALRLPAQGGIVAPNHGASFGRISTQTVQLRDSLSWEDYAALTRQLSARLGKRLLRCKGLLALGDGGQPCVIQGVQGFFSAPERLDAWPAGVPHGFLVCIADAVPAEELRALVAQVIPSSESIRP